MLPPITRQDEKDAFVQDCVAKEYFHKGYALAQKRYEEQRKASSKSHIIPEKTVIVEYVWIKEGCELPRCGANELCNHLRQCEHGGCCPKPNEALTAIGFKKIRKSELPSPAQLHKYLIVEVV